MRVVHIGALGFLFAAGCLEVGDAPPAQVNLDAGFVEVDAATPDASGPTPVTLTHSEDPASVTAANSVACVQQETDADGNTAPVFHQENSYYRVFDLDALGVTRDLAIDKVSFGIESSNSGAANQQMVEVKLHTLDGAFETANLTELATAQILVSDQNQQILEVDIAATAPAGSVLVAELLTPSGDPDRLLFIGSNAAGQTGPTYLRAPNCDDDGNPDTPSAFEEPLDMTPFFPDMHVVLSVSGIF